MDVEDYRALATDWLASQTDVPEGAQLSGANLRDGSCHFKVHALIPNSSMLVHIFSLNIHCDGTISCKDRRHIYQQMAEDETSGIRREERLLTLLTKPGGMKPYWYVEVERAIVRMDRKGVDMFVRVMLTETEPCKIPVQIKSSDPALDRYYTENPHFKDIVVGFVVKDSYSDEYLLEQFFNELDKFRKRYANVPVPEVKTRITAALYGKRAA